jgi:hypothetical protein
VNPLERTEGKGGKFRDTFISVEEGAEGKRGADFVAGDFRNGNTDFPISELVCLRTSDSKDHSTIREFNVFLSEKKSSGRIPCRFGDQIEACKREKKPNETAAQRVKSTARPREAKNKGRTER